jgi:hypothetical protein
MYKRLCVQAIEHPVEIPETRFLDPSHEIVVRHPFGMKPIQDRQCFF